ncbi:hypothetical protein M997_2360 [Proteus hauseri ATCC 700826]|uniref:Uncharacterized protein n=1 Tax=Proteus hauseri ATCC 700826 TaxID=1354271 RepID=A0AAJ3HRM5_PROHU|nr:hypothetical protein [Proteus hauseri]OAT46105.1 hypothetical protein M997_2360 [Proteus hauseri ATCC 700826]
MSDNIIKLKVSVDTSELDKLEEQLTRIKQLMQDVGIKVSIKSEQSNDFFITALDKCFIKDAVIDSPKIKFSASGDAVFSGVLINNKFDRDIRIKAEGLMKQAESTSIAIAELMNARVADQQAWAEAINRTWCSQK